MPKSKTPSATAAAIVKDPPIGTIIAFGGNFLPDLTTWEEQHGWMKCDGRLLDRTVLGRKFEPLFDVIGSSWGGDGANKFNIPGLEGYFLRGVSGASGKDPDAEDREASKPGGHGGKSGNDVGSLQADKMQNHSHLDAGHSHPADTTVTGKLPRWFAEGCDEGNSAIVNGNEGNQGNETFTFDAKTTIRSSSANLGEPVALSPDSRIRIGKETRPINAYVHWIIRWKG